MSNFKGTVTYLVPGICYVTTLKGYLKENLIRFVVKHEVGHLLGKHGYPSINQ
ncbi:MAG TPA: hypothetical protein VMV49_11920 [Candidatus Deferrimicrobium sp.]|nr:hypothetical protein [Candidatus Deferrimicrobium sp.]